MLIDCKTLFTPQYGVSLENVVHVLSKWVLLSYAE